MKIKRCIFVIFFVLIVINDETGKEKVFIYVAREDDGWKLINCYTGWLSGEAILR